MPSPSGTRPPGPARPASPVATPGHATEDGGGSSIPQPGSGRGIHHSPSVPGSASGGELVGVLGGTLEDDHRDLTGRDLLVVGEPRPPLLLAAPDAVALVTLRDPGDHVVGLGA